eukprot:426376-Rhodomonas_salina.1
MWGVYDWPGVFVCVEHTQQAFAGVAGGDKVLPSLRQFQQLRGGSGGTEEDDGGASWGGGDTMDSEVSAGESEQGKEKARQGTMIGEEGQRRQNDVEGAGEGTGERRRR